MDGGIMSCRSQGADSWEPFHCSSAGDMLKGGHTQVELRTRGCLTGRSAKKKLPLANTLAQPSMPRMR